MFLLEDKRAVLSACNDDQSDTTAVDHCDHQSAKLSFLAADSGQIHLAARISKPDVGKTRPPAIGSFLRSALLKMVINRHSGDGIGYHISPAGQYICVVGTGDCPHAPPPVFTLLFSIGDTLPLVARLRCSKSGRWPSYRMYARDQFTRKATTLRPTW